MDYYDIPEGKIEECENSIDTSIREFKEETEIEIINQKYKGNPQEFAENYSMSIKKLH